MTSTEAILTSLKVKHRNYEASSVDVYIASLFVTPWVTHLMILGIFSWKIDMGSMRIALEECHGRHGEFPGGFASESPERIPFRALGPKKAMDSMESIGPMGPIWAPWPQTHGTGPGTWARRHWR